MGGILTQIFVRGWCNLPAMDVFPVNNDVCMLACVGELPPILVQSKPASPSCVQINPTSPPCVQIKPTSPSCVPILARQSEAIAKQPMLLLLTPEVDPRLSPTMPFAQPCSAPCQKHLSPSSPSARPCSAPCQSLVRAWGSPRA